MNGKQQNGKKIDAEKAIKAVKDSSHIFVESVAGMMDALSAVGAFVPIFEMIITIIIFNSALSDIYDWEVFGALILPQLTAVYATSRQEAFTKKGNVAVVVAYICGVVNTAFAVFLALALTAVDSIGLWIVFPSLVSAVSLLSYYVIKTETISKAHWRELRGQESKQKIAKMKRDHKSAMHKQTLLDKLELSQYKMKQIAQQELEKNETLRQIYTIAFIQDSIDELFGIMGIDKRSTIGKRLQALADAAQEDEISEMENQSLADKLTEAFGNRHRYTLLVYNEDKLVGDSQSVVQRGYKKRAKKESEDGFTAIILYKDSLQGVWHDGEELPKAEAEELANKLMSSGEMSTKVDTSSADNSANGSAPKA